MDDLMKRLAKTSGVSNLVKGWAEKRGIETEIDAVHELMLVGKDDPDWELVSLNSVPNLDARRPGLECQEYVLLHKERYRHIRFFSWAESLADIDEVYPVKVATVRFMTGEERADHARNDQRKRLKGMR